MTTTTTNSKSIADKSANKLRLALQWGLAYAYLRLTYELLLNFLVSTSMFYLLALIVGMHGLQYWMSRSPQQKDGEASTTGIVQTIVVVIICIALMMDAARFAFGLLSLSE